MCVYVMEYYAVIKKNECSMNQYVKIQHQTLFKDGYKTKCIFKRFTVHVCICIKKLWKNTKEINNFSVFTSGGWSGMW